MKMLMENGKGNKNKEQRRAMNIDDGKLNEIKKGERQQEKNEVKMEQNIIRRNTDINRWNKRRVRKKCVRKKKEIKKKENE